MPSTVYTQYALQDVINLISALLDDVGAFSTDNATPPLQANGVYWVPAEITLAVQEALYYWGATTNYWRARGSFTATPSTGPYYDLSVECPTLRTRGVTFGQMIHEILYHLLEPNVASDFTFATGQVESFALMYAIIRARSRFIQDVHFPLSIHSGIGPAPPDGMVGLPQSTIFTHRAMWQDAQSGVWTPLWREDAWAADRANPQWTTEPGVPATYSQSEVAPLRIQLVPPPANAGTVEVVTVDTVTDSSYFLLDVIPLYNHSMKLPDEWAHAIKYAALADLLSADSQINDPMRAKYCENRYQQSVMFAKQAKSIHRVLANGQPLPLDSLAALDAGNPYWRTQGGSVAGAMYDMAVIPPVTATTGIAVDLSQAAPVPIELTDNVPVGYEDIDHIIDYAVHYLLFKCGGNEFKNTMSNYDDFMRAVSGRVGANKALVRYFGPLFMQPERDEGYRPDRVEQVAS